MYRSQLRVWTLADMLRALYVSGDAHPDVFLDRSGSRRRLFGARRRRQVYTQNRPHNHFIARDLSFYELAWSLLVAQTALAGPRRLGAFDPLPNGFLVSSGTSLRLSLPRSALLWPNRWMARRKLRYHFRQDPIDGGAFAKPFTLLQSKLLVFLAPTICMQTKSLLSIALATVSYLAAACERSK
jgi:hypothetical protein